MPFRGKCGRRCISSGCPHRRSTCESAGVVEQSQVAGADPAAVLYAFEVYLSGFVKMSLTLSRETGHLPCPFQTFPGCITIKEFGMLQIYLRSVAIEGHGCQGSDAPGMTDAVSFPVIISGFVVVLGDAGFSIEIQVSGFLAAVPAA